MRKMNINDYDKVHALWKECEGMDLNDIDESEKGIAKYLNRNPDSCFVEEKDNQIVGVILAGHDGRRGSVHHLAVKREYRKKGIGRNLLNIALDALKKEGIRKVGIFVYDDNEIGKEFWNSQDFKRHDDYFYMDKELY